MKFPVSLLRIKRRWAITLATIGIVASAGTAVVLATVPDSGGVIHGCYKTGGLLPNGSLRIIDTPSQTSNGTETAINWSQTGPQGPAGPAGSGGPILKDNNGQVLGPLVQSDVNQSSVTVFVPSRNRIVSINGLGNARIPISVLYESSDCTGQAYTDGIYPGSKLELVLLESGASRIHAIVADNATPQTITTGSLHYGDANACGAFTTTTSVLPYTTVSAPFTAPVALPFKF